MGTIARPSPVKLFIGMLSRERGLFEALTERLSRAFGPVDLESPEWPWRYSRYYEEELGTDLIRKFAFFRRPIDPGDVSEIKILTNGLEKEYLNGSGSRRINLDPGYLDMARLVLVSTKDFSHRIYIGKGIYGEVTLIYSQGTYQPFSYTYPDYKSEEYIAVFKKARDLFRGTSALHN